MRAIDYDILIIKQGFQVCVQANAAQILRFYSINKTVEEIKKEVPVYVSREGKRLGSSIGHIATYFINQGFEVTIHTVDLEIFDRSWADCSN
ncbi:hypothetical protein B5M47_02220 [candidate division CPR3 bacterium 4484_211]|uniref:Uncharacterized protein n=1 Tax=candidate division CPR3 bacterium 4484_211 TaxID=1968527 RepID=A0A1W9NY44_UNCC3|nr:MAG: hypothetical protein B5M47_02220 [candidate division CPR3 bacterium 4484_211]